jgi:hypothetical protein
MDVKLEEIVTLDFITNDPYTGGYINAVSDPLVEVFEEANDSNIFFASASLRSGKTGQYRVNINCFSNVGFEVDKEYSVTASANVNNVLAAGILAILVPRADTTITWDTINNIASNVNIVLTEGHGSGSWLSYVGGGSIEWSYYLESTVDATPIADVDVWVTTDVTGDNTIARGQTNSFGYVTFYLDPGTYYIWSQKSGWSFPNPDTEVVS